MDNLQIEEKTTKKHWTLEERLTQLERKEQRAKEAEAKRKTKIAKLRSAMLLQKREAFEKVLAENGIQTENQLREAMALHAKLRGAGITTPRQLDDVLEAAEQADANLMADLREQKERNEQVANE